MPSGTLNRLRFFTWCDLVSDEVDYAPPIEDYPDYPRDSGIEFYTDRYKSALGSNFWRYNRGTSSYWNMSWVDVSDSAAATMGTIVSVLYMYSPHTVIWESQGINNISLGSLFTVTPVGTYFVENDSWNPKETAFGLWSFDVKWRKEG